jgi:hypothetical protein
MSSVFKGSVCASLMVHGGGLWRLTTETLAADWLTCVIADQLAWGDKVETIALACVEDHAADDQSNTVLRGWKAFHLSKNG